MDKIKAPDIKSGITEGIKVGKNVVNEVANINQGTVENYDLDVTQNNEVAAEIVEVIPDLYQNVIIATQEELGNSANLEQLSSAFTTLLGENGISKIASSAEAAANGNFIESANIQTSYWTDKPLKFELQENGSYLILQLNEDGNYTAMGYTTEETVNSYLKELGQLINDSKDSKSVFPSGNETDERYGPLEDNDNKQQKITKTYIEKPDTTYITTNQLDANVTKEIKAYADADILGKGDKNDIYNNMSDTAKNLIDGKLKVLTPTENLEEILDREMDIVIPENAHVKIDGDYIVGLEGKTLKYDQEDNVYKIEGNNSKIGGAKYTKLEMLTLEIT